MEATKPTKQVRKDEDQILSAIRSGASPHMIARQWKLSIEEAVEYCDAVAAETKTGGISHRIMLRALLRDQAATAVRTMREIMDGHKLDSQGNRVQILATKEDKETATIRLKAADSLLKHAQRFIDEDIVRGFIEQPQQTNLQETLFDFESQVRDDGSTVLIAKPALRLAEAIDTETEKL